MMLEGFKAFPEFRVLTLGDRRAYEELVREYPPIADISFAGLMGWWGLYKAPEVALLGGNIVIRYPDDGGPKSSGLSLVGVQSIDESMCTIFDYLRDRGEKVQLLHVPEFVLENIRYPEMFNYSGERSYDEYIIPLSRFYPLEGSPRVHLNRVMRCMERLRNAHISIGPLDLSSPENRSVLLATLSEWPRKGINNLTTREHQALERSINEAQEIGLKNVCLKINGEIQSFMLFQDHADKRYVTIEYMRERYAVPYALHLATSMFAEWFSQGGAEYANLCMDFGRPVLRVAKLALGPVNFFRKYTIRPRRS